MTSQGNACVFQWGDRAVTIGAMGTHYDVLGLKRKATDSEIRSAYARDLIGLDKAKTLESARFRAVLDEAFATLIDPAKRSAYDLELSRPRRTTEKPRAAKTPPAPKPAPAPKTAKPPKQPNARTASEETVPQARTPKASRVAKVAIPNAADAPSGGALPPRRQFRGLWRLSRVPMAGAKTSATLPSNPLRQAWGCARNAGLSFAMGSLASALIYLFSTGPLLLAWIPLLAGVVGLGWWGLRYARLPRSAWQADQLIVLAGLIMFGLVSAGWVGRL